MFFSNSRRARCAKTVLLVIFLSGALMARFVVFPNEAMYQSGDACVASSIQPSCNKGGTRPSFHRAIEGSRSHDYMLFLHASDERELAERLRVALSPHQCGITVGRVSQSGSPFNESKTGSSSVSVGGTVGTRRGQILAAGLAGVRVSYSSTDGPSMSRRVMSLVFDVLGEWLSEVNNGNAQRGNSVNVGQSRASGGSSRGTGIGLQQRVVLLLGNTALWKAFVRVRAQATNEPAAAGDVRMDYRNESVMNRDTTAMATVLRDAVVYSFDGVEFIPSVRAINGEATAAGVASVFPASSTLTSGATRRGEPRQHHGGMSSFSSSASSSNSLTNQCIVLDPTREVLWWCLDEAIVVREWASRLSDPRKREWKVMIVGHNKGYGIAGILEALGMAEPHSVEKWHDDTDTAATATNGDQIPRQRQRQDASVGKNGNSATMHYNLSQAALGEELQRANPEPRLEFLFGLFCGFCCECRSAYSKPDRRLARSVTIHAYDATKSHHRFVKRVFGPVNQVVDSGVRVHAHLAVMSGPVQVRTEKEHGSGEATQRARESGTTTPSFPGEPFPMDAGPFGRRASVVGIAEEHNEMPLNELRASQAVAPQQNNIVRRDSGDTSNQRLFDLSSSKGRNLLPHEKLQRQQILKKRLADTHLHSAGGGHSASMSSPKPQREKRGKQQRRSLRFPQLPLGVEWGGVDASSPSTYGGTLTWADVEVRTVDDEADDVFGPGKYVDILVTDTEGHDYVVGDGAWRTLREGRVGLYLFELWGKDRKFSAYVERLEGIGFECFLMLQSPTAAGTTTTATPAKNSASSAVLDGDDQQSTEVGGKESNSRSSSSSASRSNTVPTLRHYRDYCASSVDEYLPRWTNALCVNVAREPELLEAVTTIGRKPATPPEFTTGQGRNCQKPRGQQQGTTTERGKTKREYKQLWRNLQKKMLEEEERDQG